MLLIKKRLITFLSISEIKDSKVLLYMEYILFFYFIITFHDWGYSFQLKKQAVMMGFHTCWPHFQSCGDLYLGPTGIGLGFISTFLFSLLGFYFLLCKRFLKAHLCLLILFLIKFFFSFIYSFSLVATYDHYHMFFVFIFLFLPHKQFFLKATITFCYLLAATIKMDEGWLLAYTFGQDPIIPFFSTLGFDLTLLTFIIFLSYLSLPWILFSNKKIRYYILSYFLFYHTYTIFMVGYHYNLLMVPVLFVLFGPWYKHQDIQIDRKSAAGWLFLFVLLALQFVPILIPGNQKLTGEGVRYALYMFDARRDCVSRVSSPSFEGDIDLYDRSRGFRSCYTYREWFFVKQVYCKQGEKVKWKYYQSINGGPYYKLVDTENTCSLKYKPFVHNEWIKLPNENTEILRQGNADNIKLGRFGLFIKENYEIIRNILWYLWFCVLLLLLAKILYIVIKTHIPALYGRKSKR